MRTSFPLSPSLRLPLSALLLALAAPFAAAADATAKPAAEAVPLQDLDYSGDQSALLALDADVNAAGTDAKKLAALESRLLALLKRPDGSIAARQAAAQRLGLVLAAGAAPSKAALDLLRPMLIDAREADLARLALEPVPGATIDALFVESLAKTTGRTRAGLLLSLAKRAPASAVPALAALLTEPETAALAATALGQIGDSASLAALRTANATLPAVVEAKLTIARRLPVADGLALSGELLNDTRLPAHQRAAALRTQLDLAPTQAAARITEVLAGTDWTPKQAALESIFYLRTEGLIAALAAKLGTFDSPTQIAVLHAFSRRADAAATAAVVTAAKSTDTAVRAAALTTLGFLPGTTDLVALLAGVSAAENFDDAKLARASLARLSGAGINESILAGAAKGDAKLRAVYIEALAARNQTETLAFLRDCRREADATLRTAAVGALGDLAPTTDQALLLDWAATSTDATEQTRALRALVTLTLRDADTAKRNVPIFEALEKAPPATAVRLMPVLGRLGGKASAECASRLALSADATVADAATATLTRWTDSAAQAPLVSVAKSAKVDSARRAAAAAALRYFEKNREVWTAEDTTLVSQLLSAAPEPAAKLSLVKLLNRAADPAAADLAQSLSSDAAVAEAAKVAALCITANRAGTPKARASEGTARNAVDGKTSTQWRNNLSPDLWIEIDYLQSRPLHRLTLDQTGRTNDYAERYEVYVTDDPAAPGKPIATGAGQRNRTIVDLPAGTKGRYVILKNTAERPDGAWAICELFVD